MNAIDRTNSATLAARGGVASGITSNRQPPTEHEKLVKNTQKWVANTFYGAMLKEMRKSPFHSDEFEGGRGGQAYEEMFDQHLADHMSEKAGSPLVNSIVNRIESRREHPSVRTNLDATTAYARIMQGGKPKALDQHGSAIPSRSATPPRSGRIPRGPDSSGIPEHSGIPARRDSGRIPLGNEEIRPQRGGVAPAIPTTHQPASPTGRRRQDKILPELTHVAPTR